MIVGIILAGGASIRMGTPKPMLTIGKETFLQHIIRSLHKVRITKTVIVLGAFSDEIQSTLSWYSGAVAVNPNWNAGQLSSLRTGVAANKSNEWHGFLIYPVDHPLVSHESLVDILHAFWTSDKNIIIPTYEGKRGHPVIFGKLIIEQLPSVSDEIGAKELVRNNPDEILEVPVNDPGVIRNIDTPEDYQNYIQASIVC